MTEVMNAAGMSQGMSPSLPKQVILERLRSGRQEGPRDAFKSDLSPRSISSKLALLGFASAALTAGSSDLHTFTVASFLGFVVFSLFYGLLRLRSGE